VGVVWCSVNAHHQSITFWSEYDPWNIVNYYSQTIHILAIASFNFFFPFQSGGTNVNGGWFKNKSKYTKTITSTRAQITTIKHAVNVIHSSSHLICANECRNIDIVNIAKMLEVLYIYIHNLCQPSEQNEFHGLLAHCVISSNHAMRCKVAEIQGVG